MVQKLVEQHDGNIKFFKPFLIGLFVFSVILVPTSMVLMIILPIQDFSFLNLSDSAGGWMLSGFILGLLLSIIASYIFTRTIKSADIRS